MNRTKIQYSGQPMRFTVVLAAILGICIGLLGIWPFLLAFMVIGLVITLVANLTTGYYVDPLFVLSAQFILMVVLLTLLVLFPKRASR